MAHGFVEPIPNYVCKNSGRFTVRNEDNEIITDYFTEGDKVDISNEFYSYYSENPRREHPTWRKLYPQQVDMTDDDTKLFCQYNKDYYGDYLYIDKQTVQNHFRPIVHKHLNTKLFAREDKMNEFLATLKIDCLKDIKIGKNAYLVIYIDMGDDE